MEAIDRRRHLVWLSVAVFAVGLGISAWHIARDDRPALRHPAIISTAYASFALWAGALALRIPAKPGEWIPSGGRFRIARWTWLLAALMYVIHVGVAFHFAHRWQHAKAYEHVEATSGFGPGIYVSYAFSIAWVADALWLLVGPRTYADRPKWLDLSIQFGFAFIVLNGTVVFGHAPMRWVSSAVFAVLAGALLKARWEQRRSAI